VRLFHPCAFLFVLTLACTYIYALDHIIGFHGLEAELMLQALESLQSNGRVQLYSSGVLDETGVKFLPSVG
jgi:hypothetical protein